MSAVVEESDVTRWMQLRGAADPWQPPLRPTVIVVPHPDDETLLCGGLLARQAAAGVPITVIAVTDGESAYPGDPEQLADRRRREQRAALHTLTDGDVPVHRLGIPDGEVAAHLPILIEAITEHLTGNPLIVAPWRLDHHCDHEAVGRAAHQAARLCGAVLAEGFFWTWHHRQPHELPRSVSELPLTSLEFGRRRRALRSHRSQLNGDGVSTPVLHPGVLGPMEWRSEYFLVSDLDDPR